MMKCKIKFLHIFGFKFNITFSYSKETHTLKLFFSDVELILFKSFVRYLRYI